MTEEKRICSASRILFYYQHKMRKAIDEIKRRLEELEQKPNNLFKIGDN